jgi:hypothetical protein
MGKFYLFGLCNEGVNLYYNELNYNRNKYLNYNIK